MDHSSATKGCKAKLSPRAARLYFYNGEIFALINGGQPRRAFTIEWEPLNPAEGMPPNRERDGDEATRPKPTTES